MQDDKNTNRKRGSLQPLRKLVPYVSRYRPQVAIAIFFLLLAAATTLTLPMAVRRVIDYGFSDGNPELVNSYFSVLIGIALMLALASSCRYYFVIWLGERIVADLRKDVFDNVTRLSASFFDTARSGEIISRLTADTTQIKSAVGATASLALRNVILGIGAVSMMIYTSPWLSMFVVGAIPLI
ncbi:MAG: ABC transporter transmembrane domain-containing protein, partial [Pseudomonadota bacterium]